ncbi:MAG: Uma2 family endonuclease [Thioploca sp.]|nr:Uma2 family endonuclease [Thioploca sp.]
MPIIEPTFLEEQRVLLHNISWQTFKTLLVELGESRASRLTYDQGCLEIMAPQSAHENANRLMELLIGILVEELNLEIKRTGSLTCKRDDLTRGAEPDSCYYIQQEAKVRHKDKIDLTVDPPPDLVIEIEYTLAALPKLPIYAALGVPELWRYNGKQLFIYQLVAGEYQVCQSSPTFASINIAEIPRFLQASKQQGEVTMAKTFRQWVKQQI